MANPALAAMLGYEAENELRSLNLATDIFVENEFSAHMSTSLDAETVRAHGDRWRRKGGQIVTVESVGGPCTTLPESCCTLEVRRGRSHQRTVEHRLRTCRKWKRLDDCRRNRA